jgi:ATP-dependent Lhr-like helicase
VVQGPRHAKVRSGDGPPRAVEQPQGVAVPASALESLALLLAGRRLPPAMLDELTAAGEVPWAGQGLAARQRRLGVAADRRRRRPDTPAVGSFQPTPAARQRSRGAGRAALFFRQLSDRRLTDDPALVAALWDSSGPAGSPTTPRSLRALLSGGRTTHGAKKALHDRAAGTGRR